MSPSLVLPIHPNSTEVGVVQYNTVLSPLDFYRALVKTPRNLEPGVSTATEFLITLPRSVIGSAEYPSELGRIPCRYQIACEWSECDIPRHHPSPLLTAEGSVARRKINEMV